MKIKLSQHTPRITEGNTLITRKKLKNITTTIRGRTLEDPEEIYLMLDAILVMRRDIFPDIVLRKKIRRRTRKDMLVMSGQTRVYFNVPTRPLAHWPFR